MAGNCFRNFRSRVWEAIVWSILLTSDWLLEQLIYPATKAVKQTRLSSNQGYLSSNQGYLSSNQCGFNIEQDIATTRQVYNLLPRQPIRMLLISLFYSDVAYVTGYITVTLGVVLHISVRLRRRTPMCRLTLPQRGIQLLLVLYV